MLGINATRLSLEAITQTQSELEAIDARCSNQISPTSRLRLKTLKVNHNAV